MSPVPRHRHDEAGSTSVFAICVAAVLMLLAGLCIDGGRVLNTRATLADTAEHGRPGSRGLTEPVHHGAAVEQSGKPGRGHGEDQDHHDHWRQDPQR